MVRLGVLLAGVLGAGGRLGPRALAVVEQLRASLLEAGDLALEQQLLESAI